MTLIDQIIKNLAMLSLKKKQQKKEHNELELEIKKATALAKESKVPGIAAIVSNIKPSLEKTESKSSAGIKIDDVPIREIKEESDPQSGGYGTAGKNYGQATSATYVDYDKIFSYLGKFRAGSFVGENSESRQGSLNSGVSFTLADSAAVGIGTRFVKYFLNPNTSMQSLALSNVPVAGMTPEQWSSFRLWMQLDPVMYRLKTTTS